MLALGTYFAIIICITWILGAIFLFFGQKQASKINKIILIILGILLFIWPLLIGVWNNYIAPLFRS